MKKITSFILFCAVLMLASCESKNEPVVPVSSISISESLFTLEVGKGKKLYTRVTPGNASDTSVVWTSSNSEIAVAHSNGVVEAMSGGKATITATTKDGGKSASCTVNVLPPLVATASSGANVSGNEGGADFAVDGNMNTFWHSYWGSPANAPLPHWLQVDMGGLYNLNDVEMWRRGDGNNNDIKTCILQTSVDGTNWTDVETYEYSVFSDRYRKHTFDTPVQVRYVRFYITESNRPPFAGIAEIKVNRTPIN